MSRDDTPSFDESSENLDGETAQSQRDRKTRMVCVRVYCSLYSTGTGLLTL
jgi:hypothetical protein